MSILHSIVKMLPQFGMFKEAEKVKEQGPKQPGLLN